MTRKGRLAAIALLLMVMLMLAACSGGRGNPGSTAPNDVAVAAMKAMTQAADTGNYTPSQATGVSSTGNTYTLTDFKADDGVTTINGTFQMDSNGNVIDADLRVTINNQTLEFILKPASTGTGSDITVDTTPVSESVMPDPMTPEEERAFRVFLIGFDEVQDEIRDSADDAFDEIYDDDDHYGTSLQEGSYPIPDILKKYGISGEIHLGYERDDDRELEIVGGKISFSNFRLEDGGRDATISGEYIFSSLDDDYEEATMRNITLSSFNDGVITLSNFTINGTIIEDEISDDDRFTFDGTASGTFEFSTGSSSVSFDGIINAEDDSWIEFPEYSLKIDGREVAIGRPERPFR